MNQDVSQEKEGDDSLQGALPALKIKSFLAALNSELLELKAQALKRYTEASLITKLEKEGIGRPSTYAAILANIKSRDYVQLKGKVFQARATAEIVVDTLIGKFEFLDVSYTRDMEEALDEIAEGKMHI